MSRVEQIGDATLYLGDCLEILPTLDPVDHVIADPPYEEVMHAAVGKINRIRNDGFVTCDDIGFESVDLIRPDVARIVVAQSKGWVILFTLAEGVRAWRDDLQTVKAKYDTCLFWVKPDASPRFNGQGAARGAECAVTAWCGTGYRSWNAGGKRGVYTHCVNAGREGQHPTEKPVPLMMELVADFTNFGQTICDPFMGSGTTGVACARLGRKFIGIEKDGRWFELSCKRIEQAYRQADLFVPAPAKPIQTGMTFE